MGDSALQKTLDYACGAGADCNPIKPNGQCYNPNTVRAHCNYAVNSYFQKRGQAAGACDFASTASVTTSDPSELPKHKTLTLLVSIFSWMLLFGINLLLFFCVFGVIYRCDWLCLSF